MLVLQSAGRISYLTPDRQHLLCFMGLTDPAFDIISPTTTPRIFLCKRKHQIILQTLGIDLAKRHDPACKCWHVRPPDARPKIQRCIEDIEVVLASCGYIWTGVHPRTKWAHWQIPA